MPAVLTQRQTVTRRKLNKNPFRGNRVLRQKYESAFPDTADRLWAIRETMDVSQKALAEELDLSPSCISRIECGYGLPNARTLIKIAKAIGVSADFLLNISDQKDIAGLPARRRRA